MLGNRYMLQSSSLLCLDIFLVRTRTLFCLSDSGFYSLFTHMIRQRKKVLGKASEEKHTVKKA